jgi:hypothetical protein
MKPVNQLSPILLFVAFAIGVLVGVSCMSLQTEKREKFFAGRKCQDIKNGGDIPYDNSEAASKCGRVCKNTDKCVKTLKTMVTGKCKDEDKFRTFGGNWTKEVCQCCNM